MIGRCTHVVDCRETSGMGKGGSIAQRGTFAECGTDVLAVAMSPGRRHITKPVCEITFGLREANVLTSTMVLNAGAGVPHDAPERAEFLFIFADHDPVRGLGLLYPLYQLRHFLSGGIQLCVYHIIVGRQGGILVLQCDHLLGQSILLNVQLVYERAFLVPYVHKDKSQDNSQDYHHIHGRLQRFFLRCRNFFFHGRKINKAKYTKKPKAMQTIFSNDFPFINTAVFY